MLDPALVGVATLGRIRDLHKSKMAAIEIGSNGKVAITIIKMADISTRRNSRPAVVFKKLC